jgi:orotate phosphoribosyltransferase
MEATAASDADLREELRRLVLDRGYERRETPFPLSAGGTSRDYVDLRRAVAGGADLEVAGRSLAHELATRGVEFDAIGGMTMGADPWAHAVAMLTGRSWFSVRKAVKDHGRQQRIEGSPLGPGVRVVVMEDTVSTGQSLFSAYEVVRDTEADVVAVCTVLDRGDVVAPRFAEAGVNYFAVLTYRDLGIEPIGAGAGETHGSAAALPEAGSAAP